MIVFGWTRRGLTSGFLSSGSLYWYFSHEPSSLFHHSVSVDLSVSIYDDALTELVIHYANRTLIVSCTRAKVCSQWRMYLSPPVAC